MTSGPYKLSPAGHAWFLSGAIWQCATCLCWIDPLNSIRCAAATVGHGTFRPPLFGIILPENLDAIVLACPLPDGVDRKVALTASLPEREPWMRDDDYDRFCKHMRGSNAAM